MKSLLFAALVILLTFGTSTAHWSSILNPFNWFKSKANIPAKRWTDFHVTFMTFSHLPKTSQDAENDGWVKTGSCGESSYFRGNRYVLDNDKSTMVLYDSNGDFAGIQFGIAKSLLTEKSFTKRAHWNEEGDSLVITAYFTHPSSICNGGRADDNLYIQTGPSPRHFMNIPYQESDLGSTLWVKGKCFIWMGQHYWYNIFKEMSCNNSFPVFLLYNWGKLTGFGWAMIADVTSNRVEHPSKNEIKYFFQPDTQPKCLQNVGTLTTQHIYLKKHPKLIVCNPFKRIFSG